MIRLRRGWKQGLPGKADLLTARQARQFFLVFQPIVAISDGDLWGFEALMRWRHPTRGEIAPSIFIPVAEASGLIAYLGEWALQDACRQAASWPWTAQVSVNISATHVRSSAFPSAVMTALAAAKLAPTRLELEITESVRLEASKEIAGVFEQLRSLGIRLVLDDFGTGWASLDMLRRLPFDGLKIDRSLVADLPSNPRAVAIVRATMQLARELDIRVTAEGVEDATQLRILRDLGCERLQGFLVAMPERTAAVPSRDFWRTPMH
ncbi:EAL domain-containing protein [Inquilinus sp. Marseille-Q2685]|uniref:EAL domain-containing protein n=1 Tax=Inquilinus sp. Marseille-Q2685 TaxID=2866581 RepID=UPI0027E090FE|nr:EAL domain-containing protein [Inquilinus sp. Marseille-Q2685]